MADLSFNQKSLLKAWDDGVKYACRKMLDKLFYVPENWKVKETKALYDIIYHTIQDLETLATHEEE